MMTAGKQYKTYGGDIARPNLHHGRWLIGFVHHANGAVVAELWNEDGTHIGGYRELNLVEPEDKPALWSSPEDVPVGAVIRKNGKPYLFAIIQADNRGIMVAGSFVDYARMADYEWRWPQETTWRPCVKGES